MPEQQKVMYAPFIDGLRALAVLAVLFYHVDAAWMPGGFVGVDAFFVISGFVVSLSASQYVDGTWLNFVSIFYARRLARITPALVVSLAAAFIATTLFIPASTLSTANLDTGLASFFGLSNFALVRAGRDYFSPNAEFNMFTHTWSLAIEEQFYLCLPLLFFPWGRGRKKLSILLFALAAAATLALAWKIGARDPSQAFYMLWTRFWELAAGVLLFQVMSLRGHSFAAPSPPSRPLRWLAALSLLAFGLAAATASQGKAPYPACLLPVTASLGLLGSLHGRPGGLADRFLTARPCGFWGASPIPCTCGIGRSSSCSVGPAASTRPRAGSRQWASPSFSPGCPTGSWNPRFCGCAGASIAATSWSAAWPSSASAFGEPTPWPGIRSACRSAG